MHNKLVHPEYYKIVIFLLVIALISFSYVKKSESNTLVSKQNIVTNENNMTYWTYEYNMNIK